MKLLRIYHKTDKRTPLSFFHEDFDLLQKAGVKLVSHISHYNDGDEFISAVWEDPGE